MFQICKHIEDIICYKCVYFSTISCIMNTQIHEKFQKFLLFSELFYVFSFISMQIQYYNEIILVFHVCKHVGDIICQKCVHFGTISCINEYTNSGKILKFFVVFKTVLCIFVHFYGNTTLSQNNFDVPPLYPYRTYTFLQMCVCWHHFVHK